MMFVPTPNIRAVHTLNQPEIQRIRDFLQGAVYAWLNHHPDEWFAAKTLVGGLNRNWGRTPPQELFDEHHHRLGKSRKDAYDQSGIELGHILKAVLNDDRRLFEIDKRPDANYYRWVRPPVGNIDDQLEQQEET
jgi:hypothetical protein